MKKYLSLFLGLGLLFLGFSFTKAQEATCDPDALVPVAYGQRGSAVRNAQACLMEAGYDIPAGATGYYGSQTKAAVQAFYADWYGAWHGLRLGPRGVEELKSRLAGAPSEEGEEVGGPSQPSQPSQQDQVSAIVAAVLAALQQMGFVPSTSTQQQAAGEEGFLRVEKDPTVAAPTLREGESGRVAGLRFRADSGAVTVKSVFLRWTGNVAPHRVLSALKLVDASGNVLYQTSVNPSTFLQDSSLNYYLPISGLNVQVPKNGYASVFVEVTVVGTLPSGVTSASFQVNAQDVRGVDGAGVNRFAPDSNLTWNFSLQPSLAGSARFELITNQQVSPRQGYVFGDPVDGKAYRVKVFSFDVTAKNDNLRLTRVAGSVTNTTTVTAVYLAQGSNVMDVRTPSATGTFEFDVTPSNFVINRDQTVTFDVLVDFTAPVLPGVATFTVSVATTTGVNSLGDQITSTSTSAASELMRAVRVGPQFTFVSVDVERTYNSNFNSSTVSRITYVVDVKAVNGPVYLPTTSAATATISGGTSTSVALNVKEVKVGTTVVNPSSPNGYYVVPSGATYRVTYEVLPAITYGGPTGVNVKLNEARWSPDDGTNWINADFLGAYPEFQVTK